jgi:hypothetical protein
MPQQMQQRKLIIVFVIVGVSCVALSIPIRIYLLQGAIKAATDVPSMTPSTMYPTESHGGRDLSLIDDSMHNVSYRVQWKP